MSITLIRLRAYLPIWNLQLEIQGGPKAVVRLMALKGRKGGLWQLIFPFYNIR